MKQKPNKITLFKGVRYIGDNPDDALELLVSMGYIVYENPICDAGYLISDKRLTYGYLKKHAWDFDIDLEWWETQTDFDKRLNEELDEVRI